MSPLTALAGWLATYAIHSTILLGLAFLVAPRLRSDAWRDLIWKITLLGGLFTASFQTGVGYSPLSGRLVIENADSRDRSTGYAPEQTAAPAVLGQSPPEAQPLERERMGAVGGVTIAPGERTRVAESVSKDAGQSSAELPWAELLVGSWAALAVLLLVRLALQHIWLFRILRGRRWLSDGALAGMIAELRRNAGVWIPVRLSASAECPTPIALGRLEICVPERFLTDLDAEQQRSALAHELAHLRRHDPIWQLCAGIIESIFFFQPLNRIGRRRWREAAENLCDDWAVQNAGSPLGLARCLTDIASWVGPMRVPETTAAMAEGGSPLLRRVERLAEWRQPSGPALWLRPVVAAVFLAAVALVAPAVSQRGLLPPVTPPEISGAQSALARADLEGSPSVSNHVLGKDSIIVLLDASVPLAERWDRALELDLPNGFWIAWGVDGSVRPNRAVTITGEQPGLNEGGTLSSNSPGPGAHTAGAPPLRAMLAPEAEIPRAVFVFGFAAETDKSGDIDWIRIRSVDAPLDLVNRPLLWLGRASTEESLAQLRRLLAVVDDPALRKEIVAALALHEDERMVVRAVAEVIARENSDVVRAEAIQWLPRGQEGGPELVTLLVRTAEDDPSPRVQKEAVDALAKIGSPEARRALRRIVDAHPDRSIRADAADALAKGGQ